MKLKDYLKKNGIKQTWMAEQIDYSATHLTNIINGRFLPSAKLLRKIETFTNGQVTALDFYIEI